MPERISGQLNDATTLADVRVALRDALTSKYGEREAAAMARIILTTLKGWSLPRLIADEEKQASDFIKGRSEEILKDLIANMPLQYALGQTSFYGLTLKVAPGVLIPRPETEELVDLIVKENKRSDLHVLDLCTGSGAIALALSRNLPFSQVVAVDISPKAVAIAQENAEALKADIDIIKADIFSYLPDGRFDIIVANPPYVDESEKAGMEPNVLDYEPHIALFVSDDDPLIYYRRIDKIGLDILHPGGKLYFEINPRHAVQLRELLEKDGYNEVEIIKDIHGKDRFAKATR